MILSNLFKLAYINTNDQMKFKKKKHSQIYEKWHAQTHYLITLKKTTSARHFLRKFNYTFAEIISFYLFIINFKVGCCTFDETVYKFGPVSNEKKKQNHFDFEIEFYINKLLQSKCLQCVIKFNH